MAMNGDELGVAMRKAIDLVDQSNRDAVFRAMGRAIVSYLIANVEVVVTTVSGVLTGSDSSGPGTGTIV